MHMTKTILVVEDDSKISHLVSEIITDSGYEVVLASTGNKAILQYAKHKPDLVIMDISMPEKDGDEASIEIKKQFPDAKIILMTAFGRDWVEESIKSTEILGVLHKPFEVSTLQKLLTKYA